ARRRWRWSCSPRLLPLTPVLRTAPGVAGDELDVPRVAGHELVVGADVHHPSPVEVDDLVGQGDGRGAVGHDEDAHPRAARGAEPGEDLLLDDGVDGAGRVVQD